MTRKLIAVICLFLLAGCLFAEGNLSLSDIFSADIVEQLQSEKKIEKTVYMEEYEPSLFPKTALGTTVPSLWEKSGKTTKPVFYYEALTIFEKKNPTEVGAEIKDISVIMRSISSLEGMEYYSPSRKKMRTLYDESYVIASPEDKTKIPDPVEGSADGLSLYAVQKDLTFGRYIYEYNYKENQNEVLTICSNYDAIRFLGIPIIKADNLIISTEILDLGDTMVMYALVEADVASVSLIENKLKKSFAARVEALSTWFAEMYSKLNS